MGYVWPTLPRKEWKDHKDDKCPHCNGPRFIIVTRGGKDMLEPCRWVINLDSPARPSNR